MNMHRLQSDGNLRDSDNWQKGIPMDVYMKSAFRHFHEWWSFHRTPEEETDRGEDIEGIGAMCGLMFNVMGYLHEWLKENDSIKFDEEEPILEHKERRAKIAMDLQKAEDTKSVMTYAEACGLVAPAEPCCKDDCIDCEDVPCPDNGVPTKHWSREDDWDAECERQRKADEKIVEPVVEALKLLPRFDVDQHIADSGKCGCNLCEALKNKPKESKLICKAPTGCDAAAVDDDHVGCDVRSICLADFEACSNAERIFE
jgi:hypothetical protein